jgi:hypothetical protein
MTHTFDFEVSLHSWLLWPTVRQPLWQLQHDNMAAAAPPQLGQVVKNYQIRETDEIFFMPTAV